MSKRSVALWACLALTVSTPAWARADDPPMTPAEQARLKQLQALSDSLHPQFGDVRIDKAGATLHLGKSYYYLSPAEAGRVLTEGWGNPPGEVDGMVFPVGENFATSAWGAVVTFEPSGFVSDKDADKTDYGKMLKQVQDGEADLNKERAKAGFEAQHVVGWAQPPYYDKARHTLVWAREIAFVGEAKNTLNYDARVLGRKGVLSLNMVSSIDQLPQVRQASQAVVQTADFDAGARYADFDPKTDKTAEYGVAGLVAAGLGLVAAKKLGLLAVLLLFLKKGAVVVLAGGGAAWAWLKRTFGGKSAAKPAPVVTTESQDEVV